MELSKEEIAEFEQALKTNSGKGGSERVSKEIKSYDFIHPDKLSKVHLRVLQSLMSSLEKIWAGTLSNSLKREVSVEFISLEQTSYATYAGSLSEHSLVFGLLLGQLAGIGLLGVSADLAISMVDRMAGGDGKLQQDHRNLTLIEKTIIKRLVEKLAFDVRTALKPVTDIMITVEEMYDSTDDVQLSQEEMLLVAGFNWSLPTGEFKAALAFPVNAFDSIRDLLTPEHCMQSSTSTNKGPSTLASELLGSVQVVAAVELGRARVSMQDIVEMGIGDVIRLDRSADEPVTINVQGRTKFLGRPGLVGSKLAVQIMESAQNSSAPGLSETTPARERLQEVEIVGREDNIGQ